LRKLVRGLLCLRHGPKKAEEVLYARDFERLMNALIDTHQPQGSSILLPADIRSHKRSNSSGIGQRHISEIQNQSAGFVGAHFGLEVKYVGQRQRT